MGISRVTSQFYWIIMQLGILPLLGLAFLAGAFIVILLIKPEWRLYLGMIMIAIFALSIGQRRGLVDVFPTVSTILASFRWIFAIPAALTGLCFVITMKEMKNTTTIMLRAASMILFLGAIGAIDQGDAFLRITLLAILMIGIVAYGFNLAINLEPKKIMLAWLFTSFALALIGVLWLTAFRPYSFLGYRFNGFASNPNQYGIVAAIMIVPAIWYILEEKNYRYLSFALAGWWFASMLLTASRASIIILVPIGAYLALVYAKKPVLWLSGGFAGFLLIITSQYWLEEHIVERLADTAGSGRYEMWNAAWRFVQHQPLLGYGFGWTSERLMVNLHNSYLLMLIEIGFLGTIPLMGAFLFIPLRGLFKRTPGDDSPEKRCYRLCAALILGMLLNAVFENWIVGVGNVSLLVFFLIIGLQEGFRYKVNNNLPVELESNQLALPLSPAYPKLASLSSK